MTIRKSITTKQLITKLEGLPQDAEIIIVTIRDNIGLEMADISYNPATSEVIINIASVI